MRSFLIKRILQAAGVVICISALTFFILNVVPGDPVRVMMGDMADEQTVQQVRHTMGLDSPCRNNMQIGLAKCCMAILVLRTCRRNPSLHL